jgi:hypothetical protein
MPPKGAPIPPTVLGGASLIRLNSAASVDPLVFAVHTSAAMTTACTAMLIMKKRERFARGSGIVSTG